MASSPAPPLPLSGGGWGRGHTCPRGTGARPLPPTPSHKGRGSHSRIVQSSRCSGASVRACSVSKLTPGRHVAHHEAALGDVDHRQIGVHALHRADRGQRVGAALHQLGCAVLRSVLHHHPQPLGAGGEVHGAAHRGGGVVLDVPSWRCRRSPPPGRRRARTGPDGRRGSWRSCRRGGRSCRRARRVTYCLPALISQGSILSFSGAGPMPSTPFSEWKITSRSSGTWSATAVGMPMPRLTYQPSGMSCATRAAICGRVKGLMSVTAVSGMVPLSLAGAGAAGDEDVLHSASAASLAPGGAVGQSAGRVSGGNP